MNGLCGFPLGIAIARLLALACCAELHPLELRAHQLFAAGNVAPASGPKVRDLGVVGPRQRRGLAGLIGSPPWRSSVTR
jgi:hypothetical protein